MIRLAIRRPVATVMTLGFLAVLGVPSALRMPLELLPDIELPRLEVVTFWTGGSPELVESFVTSPIEAAAQQLHGVRTVRSTSYPRRSSVTVEFAPGTDMEFARLELAERLSALARGFPAGAARPSIQPFVPDEFAVGSRALLVYSLVAPGVPGALRQYAREDLAPELSAVDGIGSVSVSGGTDRELRVRLNPALLSAHGLMPADVRAAIVSGLNVRETGAVVRRRGLEVTMTFDDRAQTLDDVRSLPLRRGEPGKPAVMLGQVAEIDLAYAEPVELHRIDGVPAVSLYLYRQPGSNAIAVVDRVRELLEDLRSGLPAGYRLIEDHDGSERIRSELGNLRDRALLSAGAVLLVLFAAFRRWRPTLLASSAIAVSALITLDLMAWAGLSFNLLTLAGLAMGLGLIVDNAIVVLEGIEVRRGRSGAADAAESGARQVVLPVLAATLTTIIVFAPFLYLQGELRAYYVPFAITVGLALLVSFAVAFTLIPALEAHDAGAWPGDVRLAKRGRALDWPRRIYGGLVRGSVRHPWVTVCGAFLLLATSAWLFIEKVPRGRTWGGWGDETWLSVQISMPRGAEIVGTDEIARRMEQKLRDSSGIDRYVTRVRSEHASIHITFVDSLARTRIPLGIKEELVAYSHTLGGADVRVYGFGPSFYGGGSASPGYSLKLLGYGYQELERLSGDLADRLRRFPRIRDVDPNASGFWYEREKEMELVLTPDRDRLAAYDVSVEELLGQVSAYTRGQVTRDVATLSGDELSLSVKIEGAEEADVFRLMDLVVAKEGGGLARISDVATLEPRETTGRIIREDQQYQRIVAYEFRGPRKLGDHVRDEILEATVLPGGYTIAAERSLWEYEDGEAGELALVALLAVAFVYMLTAALFESLRAPLVVLTAVPLALVGVFLLYCITGETFTREAWIGAVMMTGIVVNNAILIVDRITALARGAEAPSLPVREAAVQGTLDRVRPVLMTTGTTVFGLLPLVLFADSGTSSLWRALALATIGGLVASTLLVLVTIPALYALVFADRKSQWRCREDENPARVTTDGGPAPPPGSSRPLPSGRHESRRSARRAAPPRRRSPRGTR